MKARWRAFRQNNSAQTWGLSLIFLGLYALCLGFSFWTVQAYEVIILWPANGVMLAAYLRLPRHQALGVLVLCFLLNLASSLHMTGFYPISLTDPVLNLLQVVIAGILTRYLCGPSLDMRRPWRIIQFTLGAAVPAVALTTLINVTIGTVLHYAGVGSLLFLWRHMFAMELLGLVGFTPCLLLLAQGRMDQAREVSFLEAGLLLSLQAAVTIWVFTQEQPFLFCIYIPMMLLAYRLTPSWVGLSLILTILIGSVLSLWGYGPINQAQVRYQDELHWAPDLLLQIPVFYVLMLATTLTALLYSAVISERRMFIRRLARHSRLAKTQGQKVMAAAEAKSRFLAVMSHEMRTPLNAINGFCELLLHRPDLPQDAHNQIKAVAESGDNLLCLIEDMLEASQGNRRLTLMMGDLEVLLRSAVANEVVEAFSKGLSLKMDLDFPRPLKVLCDPARLRSVVRHVVANAIKFSTQGTVRVWAQIQDDCLSLMVSDQGPGIAPDYVPLMFDMFTQADNSVQRHHGGTGAGLALARHHARAMGGDVVLVSTSPQGSSFLITARIEVLPQEIGGGVPHSEEPKSAPSPVVVRLLIVDDHALNRSVLRLMAEGMGYEVDEAANGPNAILMAERGSYAAILMDVRMPGMDGFEAVRHIRASGKADPRMSIIAVTADVSTEGLEAWQAAGLDAYLTKPFSRESLQRTLSQVIGVQKPAEA